LNFFLWKSSVQFICPNSSVQFICWFLHFKSCKPYWDQTTGR
jgi:hypothetical protein